MSIHEEEEEKTVEIPRGTGIKSYLDALEKILSFSFVKEVTATANRAKVVVTPGLITYRRIKRSEDEVITGLNIEGLLPYSVIRSNELVELTLSSNVAAIVIAQMLEQARVNRLHPITFCSGHFLSFSDWHFNTTGIRLHQDEIYGLPFTIDQNLPKESLFLCASTERYAALVDTVKTYKVTIPWNGGSSE
jgi:hypothetical protein